MFRYRTAWGETTEFADKLNMMEFVETAFSNTDEDYWRGASGAAGVRRVADRSSLLILREPIGVLISLGGKVDGKLGRWVHTRPVPQNNELVLVYVGGEPWIVPPKYFVDVDEALACIEHYLDSGGLLKPRVKMGSRLDTSMDAEMWSEKHPSKELPSVLEWTLE